MIRKYVDHKVEAMMPNEANLSAAALFQIAESEDDLYGKGRLFSIVTIDPGEEITYHRHMGEGEYYHILSGEGKYNDNGKIATVSEGDTTFCADGECHGIKNESDDLLVFIALIIYK